MSKSRNKKYISEVVKSILMRCIATVCADKESFVKNPKTDFTRSRKMSLDRMIEILLSMQGNSLPKELYDYFHKIDKSPATASAFVQQREKIKPELFKRLFDLFNVSISDDKSYRGWHLYAVDGTDVNIAKNPEDKETYFEQGFNQLHVNAIFDLLNKVYMDVVIQPRRNENERKAAIEMTERLKFKPKSILICDRGYESFNLFEHLRRVKNLDFVIRVPNNRLKLLRNLPMEELDKTVYYELRTTQTKEDKKAFKEGRAIWIYGTSNGKTECHWDFDSPWTTCVRVVRFEIAPRSYETILTSLSESDFPLEQIKALYHLRWGIETSFRELKYAIGLTHFHARKREYIEQEIFAAMTMYNFCERITASIVIEQNTERVHIYQVNYTMAIHICRDYFSHMLNGPPGNVENTISRYILPVRKGRKDKRKLIPKGNIAFIYRVA